MTVLTPKQAEIRTRETKILSLARPIIASGGLSGLSMDAIARKMKYTKGTIYNHFGCKEEILLALAIQASETRVALFDTAQSSQQSSRDRMAAIGIACEDFRTRFDDLFRIESMVRHATIWEKASEERREVLMASEARCMSLVASVGHDAVDQGDLKLARGEKVEDMMFGLWSLTYGGMLIDASSPGLQRLGIRDTFKAIHRNCNALMDGFDWQPHYDPPQHRKLTRRVRQTLQKQVPDAVTLASSPETQS